MTGYTVHTGSTVKFSDGWDRVFQGNDSGKKESGAKPDKVTGAKAGKKKSAAKSIAKAKHKSGKKPASKSEKKGKSR